LDVTQKFLIAISQKLKVKTIYRLAPPSSALKSFPAQEFMAEITCKVITFPVLSLFIETDAYIFPCSVKVLFPSWDCLITHALKKHDQIFYGSSDKTPVPSKSVWPVMWLAARPGRVTPGK
jgi:hypothetical protein